MRYIKTSKMIIIGVLLFSGCQSLSDIAKTWEGSHIDELIAVWGAPQQIIDNGNKGKIMAWDFSSNMQTMGTSYTTYDYYGSYTTYNPGQTIHISRGVTVWVDKNGRIYRTAAQE
jgi:hypothetical protein